MTTQLEDHRDHWVVKTVESVGRRRRLGRDGVVVPKGDDAALRAEIMRQGQALRDRWLVEQLAQEPVV
jgi:hypothetical protein